MHPRTFPIMSKTWLKDSTAVETALALRGRLLEAFAKIQAGGDSSRSSIDALDAWRRSSKLDGIGPKRQAKIQAKLDEAQEAYRNSPSPHLDGEQRLASLLASVDRALAKYYRG